MIYKLLVSKAIWLLLVISSFHLVRGQRSLLNWKRDLEYRLGSYRGLNNVIKNILVTSIQPQKEIIQGRTEVFSGGQVRFSDLIIPRGSLILDRHVAVPTVRLLANKTHSYVASKMNELYQIDSQLESIKRQIDDPSLQYIYKGAPNAPPPARQQPITGTRLFKQFHYGHAINGGQVELQAINFTSVDQVLRETYMENQQFGTLDSQSRVFFEGRKTFWNSVFLGQLKSGCCDRLKPLHTSRMMTRQSHQDVMSPVILGASSQPTMNRPVRIGSLATSRIQNGAIAIGANGRSPGEGVTMLAPPENMITPKNLINIRRNSEEIIPKTLLLAGGALIRNANLQNSEGRSIIGFAHDPMLFFDLSHDNYLLKFLPGNNFSAFQHVTGVTIVNSACQFMLGLDSSDINGVRDFKNFVEDRLVQIDRPSIIRTPVRFTVLPPSFEAAPRSGPTPDALVMVVDKMLEVNLLNGMRIPDDIITLPVRPGLIQVRGPVQFANSVVFSDLVQVNQLINDMQMPASVIPLHLNDFIGTTGTSDLWFMDGIDAEHVTIHSGKFDDLVMRNDYDDAQSLILRSALESMPDGSKIIRAPLRIVNLSLYGSGPDQGLLNGFKPQNLIELSKHPIEVISGRRTFSAPIHADECLFNEINGLPNWTNHLIRVDRPNTIQTVYTRLAFTQPNFADPRTPLYQNSSNSIEIGEFLVDFLPSTNPNNHATNFNFSPEFYTLQQVLINNLANNTGRRYRVLDQVMIIDPNGGPGKVNNIYLDDIVTLTTPLRFADKFVMVGKVDIATSLRADRITSNYPLDMMDLVQFEKYRIPLLGSRAPIRLNSLILSTENQASFVQSRMLNGVLFNDFADSIMSLTRPQTIESNLIFTGPVSFEGLVRTESSVNGVKNFTSFAKALRSAKYVFEDGLQCSALVVRS